MSRCRPPRPCRACRSRPLAARLGGAAPTGRPAHGRDPRALGAARPARDRRERLPADRRRRRRTRRSTCPARSGGWPGWMAGPLRGPRHEHRLGCSFQTLTLIMCASYLLVLLARARAADRCARSRAIVAAHVILLLGPPLISQDVFGYLGFARLGALHGLDPYTHVAAAGAERRSLPVRRLALPALALRAAVHARAATRIGAARARRRAVGAEGGRGRLEPRRGRARSRAPPASSDTRAAGRRRSSGLNPVLLVLAVGGAHNDTLLLLAARRRAGAHAPGASPRFRAGAPRARGGRRRQGHRRPGAAVPRARAARAGASAGRSRGGAALSLLALGAVGLIGFGSHALGFLNAVGEQQQLVAMHSVPAETARLVGPERDADWWRHVFARGVRGRARATRCGAPRAAPTGASPPAGRRSRCCSRPPGCCPGTRSGRCR